MTAEAVGVRRGALAIVSGRLRELFRQERTEVAPAIEPTIVFEGSKPDLLREPLRIQDQTGEEPSIYLG